uniref:Transposase n=1 Tax=Pseudomonas phage HRDY3 TaxID=3236930 RepID=A0AB39CEG8_9VIRU
MIWLRQLFCRHDFKLIAREEMLWPDDGTLTAIDKRHQKIVHHIKYTTHCPHCDTWRIKNVKQD